MTLARLLVLAAALLVLLVNTVAAQGLQYQVHPVDGWDNYWFFAERDGARAPHRVTAGYSGFRSAHVAVALDGNPASCRYLRDYDRIHLGTDFRAAGGTRIVAPVNGEIVYYYWPNRDNGARNKLNSYILFHGDDGLVYVFAHVECTACRNTPRRGETVAYPSRDRVVAGGEVGRVMSSESAGIYTYDAHLHLSVVDPLRRALADPSDPRSNLPYERHAGGQLPRADIRGGLTTISQYSVPSGAPTRDQILQSVNNSRAGAAGRGLIDPAIVFGGIPSECGGPLGRTLPTNDNWQSAMPLARGDFTIRHNIGATRQIDDPLNEQATSTVWFRFTGEWNAGTFPVPYTET